MLYLLPCSSLSWVLRPLVRFMEPFSARLFLLMLLLVDWAADPCQGMAPLVSGPLASTEVTCCATAQPFPRPSGW